MSMLVASLNGSGVPSNPVINADVISLPLLSEPVYVLVMLNEEFVLSFPVSVMVNSSFVLPEKMFVRCEEFADVSSNMTSYVPVIPFSTACVEVETCEADEIAQVVTSRPEIAPEDVLNVLEMTDEVLMANATDKVSLPSVTLVIEVSFVVIASE